MDAPWSTRAPQTEILNGRLSSLSSYGASPDHKPLTLLTMCDDATDGML